MQAIIAASDPEERDYLSFLLRHVGLAVARTAEARHLPSVLAEHPVDLILLAPDQQQNVVDMVSQIRAVSQAPLVMVSERSTEAQHCALLDAGADLVLERPYSSRVLSRYIRVFLRRAGSVPISALPELTAAGFTVDPMTRRVSLADGETRQLTPMEFRLLYLLMTNQGQVIPIDTIVERVWGYSGSGNRDLVRGLIRRLRLKLEYSSDERPVVENIPGIGYRFVSS
jgi:DNA-binding response OmpR family regulator